MCAIEVAGQTATTSGDRLRTGAGLLVSALLLAILIVASAALGTSILGVPTYYASGVDSRLGAQVARDFLTDQDAEATALSNADPSALNNRLIGNALSDVNQQISDLSASGSSPPAVTFQPSSITVLQAQDPSDPSLVLEVQEDGTKSVVTSGGPNTAPTQQTIGFHGNFWLRKDTGGRYLIADQIIQNQPASPLPAIAVTGAALVAVALLAVLVARQRRQRLAPATGPLAVPTGQQARQPDEVPAAEPTGPGPATVIRTFGRLHVHNGGSDWAHTLLSRPVTGFVWLRLLIAAIQDPLSRPSRDEIARQSSPPGLSRDVQLKRLRNVVAKGLREMPAPLSQRIVVEPDFMAFRLDDCSVDAIELLEISRDVENRSQMTPARAARADRVLAACQGTFLPEFEGIEEIVTDRHPTCTVLVSELRSSLIDKRVGLALRLGDHYLQGGQAAKAIAILERAIADRGERKDVADRLSAAYRAAGREAEAKKLEAKHV